MSILYIDIKDRSQFVYSLLCQDGDGPLYVKFGISCDLTQRLDVFRTHGPIKPHFLCYVDCKRRSLARELEKKLLKEFEAHHIHGEWFKFDSKDPADKRRFNDGCRKHIVMELGKGKYWDVIDVPAYLEERAGFEKGTEVLLQVRGR